jgi:hypothetical protein
MFLGSLVYAAQTAIDYANDEEALKQRLTPARVAAAAWQRAGFAAITVPMVDTALPLMGFDQLFKYGRVSGRDTNLLSVDSNSTLSGARAVVQTAALPFRLLHDDYSMSQQDWRRFQQTLPLQRVIGLKNAFNAIGEQLPKESVER